MTTYDDLKRMIYEGDPLHDKEDGTEVALSEKGLFIPGKDGEGEYVDDLLIKLMPEDQQPFWLRYRQPGTETWHANISFATYEELVSWVYEL